MPQGDQTMCLRGTTSDHAGLKAAANSATGRTPATQIDSFQAKLLLIGCSSDACVPVPWLCTTCCCWLCMWWCYCRSYSEVLGQQHALHVLFDIITATWYAAGAVRSSICYTPGPQSLSLAVEGPRCLRPHRLARPRAARPLETAG